jgi:hypothetical protein
MESNTMNLLEELEVEVLDTRNQYNGCTIDGIDCSVYVGAIGGVVAVFFPLGGAILAGASAIMAAAGC